MRRALGSGCGGEALEADVFEFNGGVPCKKREYTFREESCSVRLAGRGFRGAVNVSLSAPSEGGAAGEASAPDKSLLAGVR